MSAAAVEPFRIKARTRDSRADNLNEQSIIEEDTSQQRMEDLERLENEPDEIVESQE